MESDLGKLFIGGISWDTDEERLRQYFSSYGEVVEAVIMRDRATGRARGFGFIVFSDPSVAERVIMDKHMIDGRPVEAKKAVPRDNQNLFRRTASPVLGSPGPMGRTKKIFVGGLPSNITENEFKNYFNQFGVITDVVVMYDHNTQRPRGFGFITFDTEEAVERVLLKTFHELSGKMVEVKRAVPKELSPSPNRSPFIGYGNFGINRSSSLVNNFPQGYNLNSIGGVGRFSPIGSGRTGYSPFADPGFGLSMNTDASLSPNYGNSVMGNNLGYGRALNNSYFNGASPNRYATSPIGYNSARNESAYNSSINREMWGNVGRNYNPVASSFEGSSGNNGTNWGMSTGSNDQNFSGGYGRIGGTGAGGFFSPFSGSSNGYGGSVGELNRVGLVHADSAWQPTSATELDGSTRSFAYELGNVGSVTDNNVTEGYNRSYNR